MAINNSKEKITLYHGSKSGIIGDISPSSKISCDFGRGFYLGTDIEQAKTLICKDENPVVYKIELDLKNLNILHIIDMRDWYFTIAYNREKLEKYKNKDIYKYYSTFLNGYDCYYRLNSR